jgi:hypothetical protein
MCFRYAEDNVRPALIARFYLGKWRPFWPLKIFWRLLWYFGLLHDHFWENGYYQMKFSCWNSYNSACQIFLQAWRHALSGRLASKNIVGENTQDHLTNVGITFAQYKVGKNFINNPCQCFGSGLIDSGSEILGWIRIRIQRFDDQKLKKNLQLKKNWYSEFGSTDLIEFGSNPDSYKAFLSCLEILIGGILMIRMQLYIVISTRSHEINISMCNFFIPT